MEERKKERKVQTYLLVWNDINHRVRHTTSIEGADSLLIYSSEVIIIENIKILFITLTNIYNFKFILLEV